jgi:hypothetical protein
MIPSSYLAADFTEATRGRETRSPLAHNGNVSHSMR